jgi:hypothetical protein
MQKSTKVVEIRLEDGTVSYRQGYDTFKLECPAIAAHLDEHGYFDPGGGLKHCYYLFNAGLDSHYQKLKIQPMEYSMANNLNPMQHTIIKYVSRYNLKNGIEDLQKAMQTLQMLIDYEQKEN